PLGKQLAQYAAPALLGLIGTHPEDAERVMPLFADARGGFAPQNVDDVPRAVTLAALTPQPEDGRQQLLCGHRAVPRFGGLETGVGIAARLDVLAEVRQQLRTAAVDRFAQAQHGIELTPRTPLELLVAHGFVDHAPLL